MAKIFYFLGHEQFQPEILVKHARLAEEAGFDGVMISEHFNPWVTDTGAAGFALSTLGAIAQATQKIQLLTGVIAPLFRYHPALVAQAAATIDRLSNGRFLLGIGTGYALNEVPLGYHFPAYKERSERIIEAITIMKRLLAGEKITIKGKYYQTTSAKLYSPPLHPISVLFAAGGPKSAITAGEHADGLILSVKDVDETREQLIKPAKEKADKKQFLIASSRWTIYAKNTDQAWEAISAWRGLRAPSKFNATDPEILQKEADTLPHDKVLSHYTIVSSPDDYKKAYTPLINDLHSDIVTIQTTGVNQKELITMLGNEVLPGLQSL